MPQLITIKDVAARLNVNTRTAYRLVPRLMAAGLHRVHIHCGNRGITRYTLESLDQLLERAAKTGRDL